MFSTSEHQKYIAPNEMQDKLPLIVAPYTLELVRRFPVFRFESV